MNKNTIEGRRGGKSWHNTAKSTGSVAEVKWSRSCLEATRSYLGRPLREDRQADGKLKSEALDPLELIRRWLLHVPPKGLVRVRHYGWLSPAAHKAFLRVRFLLGLGPYCIPPALKSEPPRSPFCNGLLAQIARIAPQRGPPLCQAAAA